MRRCAFFFLKMTAVKRCILSIRITWLENDVVAMTIWTEYLISATDVSEDKKRKWLFKSVAVRKEQSPLLVITLRSMNNCTLIDNSELSSNMEWILWPTCIRWIHKSNLENQPYPQESNAEAHVLNSWRPTTRCWSDDNPLVSSVFKWSTHWRSICWYCYTRFTVYSRLSDHNRRHSFCYPLSTC